jgi:signal transduction histidine kinase
VEVDVTGVNVRARVIDNGLGIAEKHLEKIFERFYRVKDEKTRYITGTGLGLPIVKGLLDAMGGIIEVQSTPGEGSVFTVLLPVQASPKPTTS